MRFFSDPAGTRTQDPYIKSVLLYQLSYRIKDFNLGTKYTSLNQYIPPTDGYRDKLHNCTTHLFFGVQK